LCKLTKVFLKRRII